MTCSRRLFLLGTATTFAGAFLAACGSEPTEDVAKTAVPVGGSVILDKFIIAQPTAGHYVAYSATCPHEFKKITLAQGDTVRCTAHGSTFNIADGSVVSGPAVRGLREVQLTETGDRLAAEDVQA
ncbi:Ferredoxin subunit of nitrite reductase or a ring-hydroxylating dioxygenase [Corynebacterium mycetoides]|uniref:Ferredoxin subunit of nitrite reductase or a ring-hydroxylating dioxygenase n=1 Tax=Corynebacterium mycetoides TaxID=38302 RepID=A0A1G9PUA1_9CORY|nr:Rieske (2Fe-2S) protein [Corynebacterium mycetoides]SDM02051.1 Ferredoxin subunit of nitrite reductase or a ring-hydroxylating dioxygenase [Corynebacterium mycetoides]